MIYLTTLLLLSSFFGSSRDLSGVYMEADRSVRGYIGQPIYEGSFFTNNMIKNDEVHKKCSSWRTWIKGLNFVCSNLTDRWCCIPPCFREYGTCFSNAEVVYDNMPHSVRNPIECPFEWLKARWAFLKRTIALQLENVPAAIFSCFVWHNVCEMNQCGVDPDLVWKLAELH